MDESLQKRSSKEIVAEQAGLRRYSTDYLTNLPNEFTPLRCSKFCGVDPCVICVTPCPWLGQDGRGTSQLAYLF